MKHMKIYIFSCELKKQRRVIYQLEKTKEKKTRDLNLPRNIKNEKRKDQGKRGEVEQGQKEMGKRDEVKDRREK